MDGLYFCFYNSFDDNMKKQMISIDVLSQTYRTIYLIIIGILIYSVPRSMLRVLRTQEKIAKENFENKRNAQHDSLTGLYNRLYFDQHLSNYIQIAKTFNYKFALLFIDLNKFKYLNDTYGHDFGDFVLKAVAEDISSSLRENDLVARMGGDEFVIIMSQISDLHQVQSFSLRILSAITSKKTYGDIEFLIEASIGISLYPDDTKNMEELIKYADEAMYIVKRSGKEGIMFYNSIDNYESK
jgi:diguanylate cyclase (GGDEF)-like protein